MTATFNWSDYITDRLTETFDLPAAAIEIPIAPIEEALSQALHTNTLSLHAAAAQPTTQTEIAQLAREGCSGSIHLPALGQSITWILSESAIRTLFSKLLRKTLANDESLAPDLVQGVQKVLAAQVLTALAKAGFAPVRGAWIQGEAAPEENGVLCPVTCHVDDTEIIVQLFAPYMLLSQLATKATQPTPAQLQSWKVALALEIGSVDLAFSELKQLRYGDCLLLDRCTLDPATYHGTTTFTLKGKALFRAKFKGHECKLLDYPFDAIGDAPMDEVNPNEMDPNEPTDNSPWLESEAEAPPAEPIQQAKATLAPEQISLELKVELGHIEMSAARLAELAPGQVIDLGIRPEQGVECTVGGKRVAKGLLVKIGEMIGVRITEIKQ